MNIIQGTKPAGRQWNGFLNAVVTITKDKKTTIDNDIYIKVFFDKPVYYLMVYTYDVLNTINQETSFL